MTRRLSLATLLLVVTFGFTQPAAAQDDQQETRPATTTFLGDTGLWFVPTGEVVPHGRVSVSGYRTNIDRIEAFADVSDFTATIAAGLRNRFEFFGSIRFQTRIDADRRPVQAGGLPMDYPFITEGWSTGFGDVLVGAKLNLLSEYRQQPAALAVRGVVKIPSADETEGLGTGKPDFLIDGIVSKDVNARVELAGHVGMTFRGDPDEFDLSHSLRWGVGASVPSRSSFRVIAELRGEQYFDDVVVNVPSIAIFPPVLPLTYDAQNPVDALIGVVYQHRRGFFAGAGLSIATQLDPRSDFGVENESGDRLGFQARIGFHPGVAIYVPPPPPQQPPTPPPAPVNRPPTVKATCDPCTVQVGRTSTVTANAQDPDGDALTYRWTAPAGTFANPADRQTIWTAPQQEGAVPATVTVSDGKGGTASDTVTIQVIRPPVKEFTFEDVHFDFDRYTLRPEATRILDEVVNALQENTQLNIEIEGHTCNIGTAEYNLALGERRANAVRDYLAQRGITPNRLRTVSYGEERPKHDNSREETRRLNRRAALGIRIQ